MNRNGKEQAETRILIVEDDPASREVLADWLAGHGHAVRAAGTASEALDAARDFHPDVLLSDWDLGGERNGVDVARTLQSEHDLNVIFISGNPLHLLRQASRDLRVIRYLRKPVSLERLNRLIEGLGAGRGLAWNG